MGKKSIILFVISVLVISSVCFGAALTFQQVAKDSQEMRQNIAWLTDGLLNLGNNQKLALTNVQKKKILPIFQLLIQLWL